MTSNAFPSADNPGRGDPSFLSESQNNFVEDEHLDPGPAIDEENFREEFQDYDLESNINGTRSRTTLDGAPDTTRGSRLRSPHHGMYGRNRNRWQPQYDEYDEGNDVPESLLMERNEVDGLRDVGSGIIQQSRLAEQPLLGDHISHRSRGLWDPPRLTRNLHRDSGPVPPSSKLPASPITARSRASSARDRAAWRWVNISNLDQFMLEVYDYYSGCGIWCILTDRSLHLL